MSYNNHKTRSFKISRELKCSDIIFFYNFVLGSVKRQLLIRWSINIFQFYHGWFRIMSWSIDLSEESEIIWVHIFAQSLDFYKRVCYCCFSFRRFYFVHGIFWIYWTYDFQLPSWGLLFLILIVVLIISIF